MRVRDVMTPHPLAISPRTSVLSARRLLRQNRIRHLPVVEDGVVVGIVSNRDVELTDRELREALARLDSGLAYGRERAVAAVMSTPACTVDADCPLGYAADLMITHRVGALPVLDQGQLVGIVSAVDCLRHVHYDDRRAHPTAYLAMGLQEGDDRPGRSPQPGAAW